MKNDLEMVNRKFIRMENTLRNDGRRAPKLVYICAPYDGDQYMYFCRVHNYCLTALRESAVPVAPPLMYSSMITAYDPKADYLERVCAHMLLTVCDELWLFGDKLTPEMVEEINIANLWDIPVMTKQVIFE